MAIFGSKKKEATPKKASAQKQSGGVVPAVIRRPRLTEKAANLSSANVFTFDVVPGASKHDIVRALQALYKVTPVKVNVVNTKGKTVMLRTRRGKGVQNAMRKAYVFLKKGDTIDFAA
jgi:large subunit ribosomal protein L23